MRSLALLLLVTATFLQGTSNLWITASFFANQDSIAKTSCEKRLEPLSTCKGKCVLKKNLEEEQKKENSKSNQELPAFQLFHERLAFSSFSPISPESIIVKFGFFKQDFVESKFLSSVFHPPSV
jgi:hypothetical protein